VIASHIALQGQGAAHYDRSMNAPVKPFALDISLPDDAATRALGARLSAALKIGDVVCLTGDLGAGKTTLSRGLIMTLTSAAEVPSPTYTLLQTYSAQDYDIWHFDLYRLERPADVWALGIEDALYDGVTLIEWPQRLENLRPDGALDIDITFNGEGRTARLSSHAPRWQSVGGCFLTAL